MSYDWSGAGARAAAAIVKKGVPAVVSYDEESAEFYDRKEGKPKISSVSYDTNALVLQYTINTHGEVDPEHVEVIFHSGETPDTIPNLTNKSNLRITIEDIVYIIEALTPIRPAGVTILYKAKAKEGRG